jgi:menaquinone-dependent protoporphyrinogen oxidase
MRVLVTAASKHGATLEIAERIGAELSSGGADAAVRLADEVDSIEGYDAVVVGSAVYFGHWLQAARDLIDRHGDGLKARRVWLFSSGPLGPPDHLVPEGDVVDPGPLLEATGAVEHRVFPGRLDRSALGLRDRAIMRALHAPEGDFRDWDAVAEFAREIAVSLR